MDACYLQQSGVPDSASLQLDIVSEFTTLGRTFGRAMNVLGNGARSVGSSAKTVLEHPLKRAKQRRSRVQDDETPVSEDLHQTAQPPAQTFHT